MKRSVKMDINTFGWDWKQFCESGLNISTNSSSLAPCFQQLHIQLPTYAWFAIFSSYHYGKLSTEICRNRTQIICLNLRALFSLLLALTPAIQIVKTLKLVTIWPVDILLTCVQFLSWTIHFGESSF